MVTDSPWEVTWGQVSSGYLLKPIWVEQQPGHPKVLGFELGLPVPGVPSAPRMGHSRNVTREEQQEGGNSNYQFRFLAQMIDSKQQAPFK